MKAKGYFFPSFEEKLCFWQPIAKSQYEVNIRCIYTPVAFKELKTANISGYKVYMHTTVSSRHTRAYVYARQVNFQLTNPELV